MRRAAAAAGVACFAMLALAPARADAQLTGDNLLVGQAGNRPFTEPKNRTDLYDRLDLDWMHDALALGLRWERDRNSEDQIGYEKVTRRYADWSDPRLRIRAGSIYTILGRGLLHRSFELPGVVLDEPGTNVRYASSRDLDGVLLESEFGPFAARAFSGRPNGGEFSPASEELGAPRYAGQLSGGQLTVRLPRATRIGAAYSRFSYSVAPTREFGSGFVELDPLRMAGLTSLALPLTFEYAQEQAGLADWWKLRRGHDHPHAMYASANLLWGEYTLAVEYKDYDAFRLGFNDPPSLVREHDAPLLNRDTHVLNAEAEQGFQIEASAPATAWATLTANLSRSDGDLGYGPLRFEEQFAELRVAPPTERPWDASVYLDRGRDAFDFVNDRHLIGIAGTVPLPQNCAVSTDLERRRASRTPNVAIEEIAFSLTISKAEWGSTSLLIERSNDPDVQESNALGELLTSHHTFFGGQITSQVSPMHRVSLFVGERRGGRACTAGTCYQVQPFQGAELRLTSRF